MSRNILFMVNEHDTKILPIRPSVTGESDASKWERVALAKGRVVMALDAEPQMAQVHIVAALRHLRGIGEE